MPSISEVKGLIRTMAGRYGYMSRSTADFLKYANKINEGVSSRVAQVCSDNQINHVGVLARATGNYDIALFRFWGREGSKIKVLGKGAVSIVPDLDKGYHVIKSRLDLPYGFSSRGYSDPLCKSFHLKTVDKDGNAFDELYSIKNGALIARAPFDNKIASKCANGYLNREGMPVIRFEENKMEEYLADGSKIEIDDLMTGIPHFAWSNPFDKSKGCNMIVNNNGISVSMTNMSEPFEEGYPILQLTLDKNLKIKNKTLLATWGYNPNSSDMVCKEYDIPQEIPDVILNQPGFREILARYSMMQNITKESDRLVCKFDDLLHKLSVQLYNV